MFGAFGVFSFFGSVSSSIAPRSGVTNKMPSSIVKKSTMKKKSVCHYGPTNSYCISSPVGDLEMTCCPNGLHTLGQKSSIIDENFLPDLRNKVQIVTQQWSDNGYTYKPALMTIEWLEAYFNVAENFGNIPAPPICTSIVSVKGSFREKVWNTLLREVSVGETVSYGELAKMVAVPGASQAVGSAMKNNPIQFVIPCHRVVKSNGTAGLYSGGNRNRVKVWLLHHERNIGFKHNSNFY